MTDTLNFELPLLEKRESNNYVRQNEFNAMFDRMVWMRVLDRNLLTPPGSPTEDDLYIMPSGTLTGAWATYDQHDLAWYHNGAWVQIAPKAGAALVYVDDESIWVGFDGTSWGSVAAGGGGISNLVEDTTPQLGGMLDVNGNAIGDGTLELLTFTEVGAAVNHVDITNAATGNAPGFQAAGDDTNIDLLLAGKGTGAVRIGSSDLNVASGDILVSGTVDGRDVAADGAKLDGVETGATADQSDAEIETAYNSQVSVGTQIQAEDSTRSTVDRWTSERVHQAASVGQRQAAPSYNFTLAASAYTTPGYNFPLLYAEGNITIDAVYLVSNLATTGSAASVKWTVDVLKTGGTSLTGTTWDSNTTELTALGVQSLDASGTLTDGQILYANLLSEGGPTNMNNGTWGFFIIYHKTSAS